MTSSLNVVLVRTQYSSNVGACARALANMSTGRLILVDKKCEINSRARQGAAGAQATLDARIEYSTWEEFYKAEGAGLRIALTRRAGKQRKLYPLSEALQTGYSAENPIPIYLIFGPEDNGLDNEDLHWVSSTAFLPAQGTFQSLNLSQAVLLALHVANVSFNSQTPSQVPATKPFYFPEETLKTWLKAMDFDPEARQGSAFNILRRLFLQNHPTDYEIHVLESVLWQSIRKMRGEESLLGLALEKTGDDIGDITR